MALITGGTTAQTSLLGLKWLPGNLLQADVAQFNANVKSQTNPAKPIWPTGLMNGIVDFPDRANSQIVLQPGDYIFYDTNGWPIVVSSQSIAAAPWIHT